jgi:hypothetical protein
MHELFYFVLGFLLSILFVKILIPKQKVIRVVPTLDNYKDIVYVDENGVLYQYEAIELPEEFANKQTIASADVPKRPLPE